MTRWFAFQAGADEVKAGQAFVGDARSARAGDRRPPVPAPIVWVFPSFEEALWVGAAHASPRGALDALLPPRRGRRRRRGRRDRPSSYELVLQHRPRARLFEVVRLAPQRADAIAVARGWADQNDLDVDDETLAEALDLATHYLPAAVLRETSYGCSSSSATESRAASRARSTRRP